MKRIVSLLIAVAVLSVPVTMMAKEKGEHKGEKEGAGPAKELTLTGKLTKKEVGMEEKKVVFILKLADGTEVKVPEPKAKEGADVIKLADFVDKDVTITGEGIEKEGKEGKKIVILKSVAKACRLK
jgi:hypothetical protein